MIFVGDIAIPFVDAIKTVDFPQSLLCKRWFGNLEGALITAPKIQKSNREGVYNDFNAIRRLTKEFHFEGFALANNHIFDTGSLNETKKKLTSINIPFCGIGENIDIACTPLILKEGNVKIVIINLGWAVIQCNLAKKGKEGVAPLTKENALTILEKTKRVHNNAKIVFFMHWSYELEAQPQPRERELAKTLIDHGADGIIGCHPHRIGEFELYKNKPIIYSLGNWMFKQDYYFNGKLRFPDFCNKEIAFEWDFEHNTMYLHNFIYNNESSSLIYVSTDIFDKDFSLMKSKINNLSNNEYKKHYMENHYHKNKGLPIYYWEDSILVVRLKNVINILRDIVIKYLQRVI